MIELLEEGRRTTVELGEFERQNAELRDNIRRLKSDSARAASESQATIKHLEASLLKERGVSEELGTQVSNLTQQFRNVKENTDRRVIELQQGWDVATQEMARVKEELEAVRSRLDEAEFAHRALKEGGARLRRELAEKDRRIEQLEKGRRKPWNMI